MASYSFTFDGKTYSLQQTDVDLYSSCPPYFRLTQPKQSLLNPVATDSRLLTFAASRFTQLLADSQAGGRERIAKHQFLARLVNAFIWQTYIFPQAPILNHLARSGPALTAEQKKEVDSVWLKQRRAEMALRLLPPQEDHTIRSWEHHHDFSQLLQTIARRRHWRPTQSVSVEKASDHPRAEVIHVFLGLWPDKRPSPAEYALVPTDKAHFGTSGFMTFTDYRQRAIANGLTSEMY